MKLFLFVLGFFLLPLTAGATPPFQALYDNYRLIRPAPYRTTMVGEIRRIKALNSESLISQANALADFCAPKPDCAGLEAEALLIIEALSHSDLGAAQKTALIARIASSIRYTAAPATNFYLPVSRKNVPVIWRIRGQAARVLLSNAKRLNDLNKPAKLKDLLHDPKTLQDLCAEAYATNIAGNDLADAEKRRQEACEFMNGTPGSPGNTEVGQAIMEGLTESGCYDMTEDHGPIQDLSGLTNDIAECFMASRTESFDPSNPPDPITGLIDEGDTETIGVMEGTNADGTKYVFKMNLDNGDYFFHFYSADGELLLVVAGNAETGQQVVATPASNSTTGEDEMEQVSSGQNDEEGEEEEEEEEEEEDEGTDTSTTTTPHDSSGNPIDPSNPGCDTVFDFLQSGDLVVTEERPTDPRSWDPTTEGTPSMLDCGDEGRHLELDEGQACGLKLCGGNFFMNDSCQCEQSAFVFTAAVFSQSNECAGWYCPDGTEAVATEAGCSCAGTYTGLPDGTPPGGGGDPPGD